MLVAVGMVAGNEGVDRGQLVHEAVGHQEIQRPIHRRRRIGAGTLAFAYLLKQLVGLDRLAGVGDQAQHVGADRGQAQAALVACTLDHTHERIGAVDVVVRIGAGVAGGHGASGISPWVL